MGQDWTTWTSNITFPASAIWSAHPRRPRPACGPSAAREPASPAGPPAPRRTRPSWPPVLGVAYLHGGVRKGVESPTELLRVCMSVGAGVVQLAVHVGVGI